MMVTGRSFVEQPMSPPMDRSCVLAACSNEIEASVNWPIYREMASMARLSYRSLAAGNLRILGHRRLLRHRQQSCNT
jgi:hypothetical protein